MARYTAGWLGSRRGRRWGPAPRLAVLLVLALFLFRGCGEGNQPLTVEAKPEKASPISGLSEDQSRVVEEFGYPDHFFISIDPYSRDRVERWTYFSCGKALDFDNGRLWGEEPVEDKSAEYPPTSLRPQDFDSLLTPEGADQLLGEPLFTHEAKDGLMPENTVIVYEKAVLLFREGRLIGVDTQVHPPQLPAP